MGGSAARSGVDLLWIPLGAGSSFPVVHWNGRLYEALKARRDHRAPLDLYHAALEVGVADSRFVVEMTPAWGASHTEHGAVTSGPVGLRLLGRSRLFRYEVHCWRDGVIPDRSFAVGGPRTVTRDESVARRILDLAPSFPTGRWGRDDFGTGDMWNSNSLIAWLLVRAGVHADAIAPPAHGRAPGWEAGIAVAASSGPL
ncbi:MAG TPA: hypothetical protein VLV82_05755 [Candidatus Angelobacter sp.]|nr:hypothetical protein [Candidatus Angelobacter sp.]